MDIDKLYENAKIIYMVLNKTIDFVSIIDKPKETNNEDLILKKIEKIKHTKARLVE